MRQDNGVRQALIAGPRSWPRAIGRDVVSDPSPLPPRLTDLANDAEHGRGLHIVDALSARWGSRSHERPAEAVRMDVLNARFLAATSHHVADTRVCHTCCVVALDAKPEPRGRRLGVACSHPDVLVHSCARLLSDRHPGLISRP
jgi:hypothetical protein